MKYIITESGLKLRLNCQCPMTMKNSIKHKRYLLRKALRAFRYMMKRHELESQFKVHKHVYRFNMPQEKLV